MAGIPRIQKQSVSRTSALKTGRLMLVCLCALLLSACVSNSVKRVNNTQAIHAERDIPQAQLLDVNVLMFDPGLEEDADDPAVFAEVRKAEAGFIPYRLRDTLQGTGHWGPVRVVPEPMTGSELEVSGRILHSDGETLSLAVQARDATGRVWLDRVYTESAAELSYTDADPSQSDPFQDLYNRIANDLLRTRQKFSARDLADIRQVAFLRFARDVAPDAFGSYLSQERGRLKAVGAPAQNDPNVARIQKIRDRDYRLVDALDQHVSLFSRQIQAPYDEWRAASYREAENLRKIKGQAVGRMLAGAAAVAAGIYGAGHATNGSEAAASQVAILGGAYLFKNGLDKNAEAKIHKEALKELGDSLAGDVKPKVVELEGRTITLQGSAEQQYEEWRRLMRKIYAEETGFIPAEQSAPDYSDGQ